MSVPSKLGSIVVLIGFLLVVFANAALSGWATATCVGSWYVALNKPTWTPPGWLFGPAWTLLYTAMAIVAWRIWRLPKSARTNAGDRTLLLRLWWFQLALNAAWSWAFFYFRQPAIALGIIGVLLLTIGAMQPRLARIDRPAAMLWTPYVLWVAFAACLNLSIWNRN